jgi:kinesin family protein 1
MIGYGANKGIVPMATEEIFERITKLQNAEKSYEVTVSMVEIYNEKV